jgi:AbiTii
MMSLLRQIQSAAIDSKSEIASLLRMCKVLGARLGNKEFNEWVEKELSGYPSIDGLPDYRILTVNSKGHFAGAFGAGFQNGDIPLGCIPQEYRESLRYSHLTMGVAGLESLVKKDDGGALQEKWNPDLVAFVGGDIYERMNCYQAWKVIPFASLVAALDAVRTRVLNFVLEVEATNASAGEAPMNSNPIPQEKVQQIFNTYINGSVHNMATGNAGNIHQQVRNTQPVDLEMFSKLKEVILASSISAQSKQDFDACIVKMQEAIGTPNYKDNYLMFMGYLADHMQVLGVVVTPFIPALSSLLQ